MAEPVPPVKPEPPPSKEERRSRRRAEMVVAAVEAVRQHGAGVSVAEIASRAGITKPVLYRYFDDRADLQRAVGRHAVEMLMERMIPAMSAELEPRAQVAAVVDAFLAGIEDEPQLWRFVVRNPTGGTAEREAGAEIVDDAREQIARLLAVLIGERLRAAGRDSGGAEVWAHGLVGMVQSAGDWWLERRTMSRATVTGYLTGLIWGGMSATLDPPEERPRGNTVSPEDESPGADTDADADRDPRPGTTALRAVPDPPAAGEARR
ncbi:MAG: TetR/AcrR family transcriptional regulator [Pseudonocardia sp.]|uniref:TetR/AcrR family transcriptional regulator n=1 Tax=unclassified Pseudonocardia TaxID=2619320 RepID=UPI00086B89C1|nr:MULTISPECIES: TetR/AcrR family transcriptional regulator [unclassified Pseudonocardia]MBN9109523.1 TetR/AcrR family transcriptional regulator [Pseudonocardia sp.]ODV05196.1 MAG: TetR family transcriptional regulator [Pseudonocardia sp. SCN 73-27]